MAAAVEAAYKESFERVESGAALSYPCQASQLYVSSTLNVLSFLTAGL